MISQLNKYQIYQITDLLTEKDRNIFSYAFRIFIDIFKKLENGLSKEKIKEFLIKGDLKIKREVQFLLFFIQADMEGNIITYKELKEKFNMSKQHVSQLLKNLKKKKLISSRRFKKKDYHLSNPRVEFYITDKGRKMLLHYS